MGIQISVETAHDTPPVDEGLRSLGGIRWLLLAGALLTGVSAYRLVETRWDLLPAAAQYLVLCGGALAVYGVGQVARKRLALRVAGGALLSLFVALIPILAWGAAYLHLLARPLGLLAFAAGMSALLAAARQVLAETVRYRGAVYPAALAILAAAPPVLPILTAALPGDVAFLLGAGVLGLVFHAGSRHVNRFLFHRDRRDGLDRPVHAVPFVVLGLLYAAACASLPGGLAVAALPVAIAGIVLVDTGEEYHRALLAALDPSTAPPERWPKRSVALLSIGFSLLFASFAMAFARPDGAALDLVALLAAVRLVAWGLRYESPRAHVAGVLCALAGYNLSPVLYRPLARLAVAAFTGATGIASGSPGLASFGDLGFLALLLGWGVVLRRREAGERLQRTHAVVTALHALATIGFALPDLHAALLFLPLVAAVLGIGLLATRRLELLLPFQTALAAASMVIGATASRAANVLVPSGSLALALGSLVLTALGRLGERRLARALDLDLTTPARLRSALAAPPIVAAVLSTWLGLVQGDATAGALALVVAGLSLLAGAGRVERPVLAALAVLPLSLGAHLLPGGLALASPLVPAVTLLLFAASWVFVRADGRLPAAHRPAARLSLLVHGAVGVASLLASLTPVLDGRLSPSVAHFGFRPLIVLAIGLALLERGLVEEVSAAVTLGLALLVAFPALGLYTSGVLDTVPQALLVSGLALALLRLPLRAAARGDDRAVRLRFLDREAFDGPLTRLTHAWCALAVLVGFTASGVVPFAVALLVVLHLAADAADRPLAAGETFGLRYRAPLALLLPAALHLAALAAGATTGLLLGDLRGPTAVAAGLAWLLLVDTAGGRASGGLRRLSAFAEALGLVVAVAVLVGGVVNGSLSTRDELLLLVVALAHAARDLGLAWRERGVHRAWLMLGRLLLALLVALEAGWVELGHGRSPWALLGAATLLYAAGRLVARTDRQDVFETPLLSTSQVLPVLAGGIAIARTLGAPGIVWLNALPIFLASCFYVVVASRQERRVGPSVLASLFLAAGLASVIAATPFLGMEFYSLAPGLALLALCALLHVEMGRDWTRRVFTAGATLVYATPILALQDRFDWGWQAALLVLALLFGAASFTLRSKSLLVVSTAAMLVDLGTFVLFVRQTEPTALFLGGALLGLLLMGLAAWLEYRREGVLQRIRIFASELQSWS